MSSPEDIRGTAFFGTSGNSGVKYKYLNYIMIYSCTRVLKFEGNVKKKKALAVSPSIWNQTYSLNRVDVLIEY